MRNGKLGKGKMGEGHIKISADVLLLQSSSVMRKSMPINALIERSYRGTNV